MKADRFSNTYILLPYKDSFVSWTEKSLQNIYVKVRACVRACARACLCVCVCVCVRARGRVKTLKILPVYLRNYSADRTENLVCTEVSHSSI